MQKRKCNLLRFAVAGIVLCLGIFAACENPADSDTKPEPEKPATSVKFTNLEQFRVTVYRDSLQQQEVTEVAANGSAEVAATPSAGTVFYPTFHLNIFDVPGVSIPYNGPGISARIDADKTNPVNIPKLASVQIDSAFIKITNDSVSSLTLRRGNSEESTLVFNSTIVNSNETAVYQIAPGPSSGYSIMHNTITRVDFPANFTEFKRGIIYVFTYNGTSLSLTNERSVLQTLPPAVPENVQMEVLSKDSVRITWDAIYGAVSYRVYRAASAEGTYDSVGTPVTASYTDASVSAGQAYYYKITALSGGNRESEKSTAVVAIMSPADVQVTAETANSISLAWDAFSGASGYNIYRSENEDGIYSKVNTAAVTGTVFTDTGLSPDATYWYKVSAIVDGAESLLSSQIPASTSSIPGNVRVTAETANSVSLAWNAVSEASGYHVYRSATEAGAYSKVNTAAVTDTVFTDTGLSPDTTYWYKINAIISDNEGLQSIQISASTLTSVPGNVRVTAETANSVSLAWNVVPGASGYNVYRSDSEDGIYSKVNTAAVTEAGFTDTGLSPDTTYWYKVSAIIDGADGLLSGQIPASTSSVPGNVRVTSETSNSNSLAWNAVSEASGYNIYRSDSEDGIYNRINTGAVTGTEFTDTNVTAYTTYFYKVSAIISGIEGIQSSPVSASTGMVPGSSLAAKLSWLQTNALSNVDYMIEVTAAESIAPTTLSYSNRTNIGITLRGTGAVRTVSLLSNGAMFTVASGVTLVLDNNITLQGRSGNNNSLVRVNEGGTLVMNTGSRITGNTSSYGGGVYVSGTFTMNGGTISSNTAASPSSGGGVYVYSSGTFTMNSGTISSNTASSAGGGVHVMGTFIMSGGTVSGNTTSSSSSSSFSYGGGVSVTGTFTMSGGTVSGNIASGVVSGGGGVFVLDNGTFSKTGGTIYGYSASDTSNSNVVKNSSGTVVNNRGHAVYVLYNNATKGRGATAGTGVNMSCYVSGNSVTFTGDWDPDPPGSTMSNSIPLTVNSWANGIIDDGSAVWYSFNVTNGTTYRVWWNDTYDGNSTKTLDVKVSAAYSNGASIFTDVDSGWSTARSFTANTSGVVLIRVEPYSSGRTGTFAVAYSTGSIRP